MGKKVCLDAGHYAYYNQSPCNPDYWESKMTWKLHLMLKQELEKYGIEVVLTRKEQEKDLPLWDRGQKSKGCDLFVSIHSNATYDQSIDFVGIFAMVKDDTTDIDERSNDFAYTIGPVVAKYMNTKDGFTVMKTKSANDRNGDGILNDNYYGVLNGARQAGTPGVILEHSFHTNPKATEWLLQDSNLAGVAKEEAAAIAKWLGVPKPKAYWYKVQVGAYSYQVNAINMKRRLERDGYNAFIIKEEK